MIIVKKKTTLSFYFALLLVGHPVMNNAVIDAATPPAFPVAVFPITNYGADVSAPDNAAAVQKAIDSCAAAGGGNVVVPAGTFLCGPLSMKSNCNLQLSKGAVLKLLPYGSGNGIVPGSYPNADTADSYADFIYGKKLTNVGISGQGTIEGQGADWWAAFKANSAMGRPGMVVFVGCTNIAIIGITLQNAPNVHIGIGKGSFNTTIADITINSPATSPNTDGIDTWSPDIAITQCTIACGDDNIAMDDQSRNVAIKNCTFGTGHGCSIGSFTETIDSIAVDSCTFNGTTAGIRMKTNRARGGTEQHLSYADITMTGVENPIYITSYYPSLPASPASDTAQPITATTPSWRHISLKNITIKGSTNAGILWGLPEQYITDVVFDNVQITASTGMKAYFVSGLVFKNGSSITASGGNAVTTYQASMSGVNPTTGKPVTAAALHSVNNGPTARAKAGDNRVFTASGRLVAGNVQHTAGGITIVQNGQSGKSTVVVNR